MIALVLGTRPEIIKLGPIAHYLLKKGIPFNVIHTGQHFDDELSKNLLNAFSLTVDYQFHFGGKNRGAQIGGMTTELSKLFDNIGPRCVIVQGDTNSVLAGGLAANANSIPLIHVEAGLRSHDRAMPEEHNRVIVDHIADILCAPTSHSAETLIGESVLGKVVITGNTEVDAVSMLTPNRDESSKLAKTFGVEADKFILATIHRPENTDSYSALERIVTAFTSTPMDVIFSVHPRTKSALEETGLQKILDDATNIIQAPPLDPQTMWALLKVCALAVSDSGGIQEDVTVFGTPLLVVRNSCERPEALGTFAKLCAPSDNLEIQLSDSLSTIKQWRQTLQNRDSPYLGPNGYSPSKIIVEKIEQFLAGKHEAI